MVLDLNNINELRESFDHLVQKNYETQDDVRMALSAKDYWKAVKSIDNFIKIIDKFLHIALDMAKKYNKTANYQNKDICLKAEKMAKKIKAAHLEAEKSILKKYIIENKDKFKLSLLKSKSQNIIGLVITSE